MQLRAGQTYDGALKFLEDLVSGSLNDTQNAIPWIAPRGAAREQEDAAELARRAEDELKRLSQAVRQYDGWTGTAARELRKVFADPSVVARLRGERYQYILSAPAGSDRLPPLLNTEMSELRDFFADLANELRETTARYARHAGRTLVLDTNDLLHYQRFDKIPWKKVYGPKAVVVIPHVIVDEIDTKAFAESDKIRSRARGVFKLLEDQLNASDAEGWSALPDGTELQVLIDEPGHRRQPNNDDEAVARAAFLQQAVAPREVVMVTRDNGVRARALAWGLRARKLPDKYLIPEDKLSAADLERDLVSITLPDPDQSS